MTRSFAPVLLFLILLPVPVWTLEVLRNGGFEDGFVKSGLAAEWKDDSAWSKLKLKYVEDRANPHGGQVCQRLECTEYTSGRVQFTQLIPVEQGKLHTVSVWMKSSKPLPVDISFRKRGKPYSTYAMRSFTVQTEWREYRFTEMIGDDDPEAAFMVVFKEEGVLWVDDASVTLAEKKGFPTMAFSPPTNAIPDTLFGLHYNPYNFHNRQTAKDSSPWPAVAAKTYRLHDADVGWCWLEREKGVWRWDELDNHVSNAVKHQVDLIFTADLTPTWASARPEEKPIYGKYWMGCAAEPANIQDWRNFIRTVATRYKGRIKYYEGWNEPDIGGFFSGSKEKLVELQKEMYQIVKEVDPGAQVISPSIALSENYLEGLFQLGLGKWCDAVGYHFYAHGSGHELLVSKMLRVREMMKSYGCGMKPLFNTEAGWSIESSLKKDVVAGIDTHKVVSIEAAGNLIARGYLLNWAVGVPIFALYRWEGGMGLREDDYSLKACAVAYNQVARWMTGAVMAKCVRGDGGTYTVELTHGSERATILWNAQEKISIPVPSGCTSATDVFGKSVSITGGTILLGETPVLFR